MLKAFHLKKKGFATAIALSLMLSMEASVFANDTETNEVQAIIESGGLSLETSSLTNFGKITLKDNAESYNTSFQSEFTVKDLRGAHDGWRLDVSANPFKEENTEHELPIGSLTLAPIAQIDRVGTGVGGSPTVSMTANAVIDDGSVTVAEAAVGAGMGVFELTFPADALTITVDPTTAKVGTYKSTLTWNLVGAP